MDEAFGRDVVQRGRDVEGERKDLLEWKLALTPEQAAQGGAFEVLEQNVRVGTVENGVEPTHEDGVRESLENLGLTPELSERTLVLGLVRPEDLRHGEREQPLVPDEVDLVAGAPAQPLHDRPPLCDRDAGLEFPACVLFPRLPRGRRPRKRVGG